MACHSFTSCGKLCYLKTKFLLGDEPSHHADGCESWYRKYRSVASGAWAWHLKQLANKSMDKERRYRQRLTASYTVNGLKQLKEAEQRQHHEAEKQLLIAQQIQLKKDMKAEAAAARLEHIESVRGETLQHPLRLEKVEWVLGAEGATCDAACKVLVGTECTERAQLPLDGKEFVATLQSAAVGSSMVCLTMEEGSAVYDPSVEAGRCGWMNNEGMLCSVRPPPEARRLCSCLRPPSAGLCEEAAWSDCPRCILGPNQAYLAVRLLEQGRWKNSTVNINDLFLDESGKLAKGVPDECRGKALLFGVNMVESAGRQPMKRVVEQIIKATAAKWPVTFQLRPRKEEEDWRMSCDFP
jgi:hypothetical protein